MPALGETPINPSLSSFFPLSLSLSPLHLFLSLFFFFFISTTEDSTVVLYTTTVYCSTHFCLFLLYQPLPLSAAVDSIQQASRSNNHQVYITITTSHLT